MIEGTKISREEVLERLAQYAILASGAGHPFADALLLVYINDEDISEAYRKVGKCY